MKRLRGFLFLVQSLQFYFINIEMSKIWWLITAGYFSKYWQAMYFQETLVFCFLLIKRTQSIWACLFTAADLVSIVVALFQVWKLWPWGLHAHCFTCDPSFDPLYPTQHIHLWMFILLLIFYGFWLMQNIDFKCITKEADLMSELLKHGAGPTDDIIQQSSLICMCALSLVHLQGFHIFDAAAAMLVSACITLHLP